MRKRIYSALLAVITTAGALILGYLIYSLFGFNPDAITTMNVKTTEIESGITVEGMVVRNEDLVLKERGENCIIVAKNMNKVSKNELLAVGFHNQKASVSYEKAMDVSHKIAIMNDVLAKIKSSPKISEVNLAIDRIIRKYSSGNSAGEYGTKISEYPDSMLTELLLRNYLISEDQDGFVEQLKNKIASLKADYEGLLSESGTYDKILSPQSGHFTTDVDGWEQMIHPDLLLKMTYDEYTSFVSNGTMEPDTDRVIGKLILGWEWYYSFVLTSDQAADIRKGDSLSLSFRNVICDMTAENVVPSPDGEHVLIVAKCSKNLLDIEGARMQRAVLLHNIYSGFQLPAEAVHVVDGVTGVYVLEGSQVVFKPITILYQAEGYYLVETSTTNRKLLFTNDEVIITGKNLFDGKVIKNR